MEIWHRYLYLYQPLVIHRPWLSASRLTFENLNFAVLQKIFVRDLSLIPKIADILLTNDRNSRKHFTYASLLMLVSIFSQDYFFLHFPVKSPINVSLFSFIFSSMYLRFAYQCHNDYFSRNIMYLTII